MPEPRWPHLFSQLHAFLATLPWQGAHWALADRERVVLLSPGSDKALGVTQGTPVASNPWLATTLAQGCCLYGHRYREKQPHERATLVTLPLKNADGIEVEGVLLYSCPLGTLPWPSGLLELEHNLAQAQNTAGALASLAQGMLKAFNVELVAIGFGQDDHSRPLAIACNNQQLEGLLADTPLPLGLGAFWQPKAKPNLAEAPVVALYKTAAVSHPTTDEATTWWQTLRELNVNHLLLAPLWHLGSRTGLLILGKAENSTFELATMPWLTGLLPRIASLVSEQLLHLAAVEREQALNLLLRGTEILVQTESEEQLLLEAGEMAMILHLEAGFFLMREDTHWTVKAPFGRLRSEHSGWEEALFKLLDLDPSSGYRPHETPLLQVIDTTAEMPPGSDFPWQKVLIQPVGTNRGVFGELWLLDLLERDLGQQQEVLAGFARSLGVALETIRQRRELEVMATTDPLTGILNRKGFSQRLREERAATLRRGSNFVLAVLDLDGFKALNDTQGHPAGDAALKALAKNLRRSLREQDLLARTGGDEFTLVLTDLELGPAAQETLRRLKTEMGLEEFGLGVSIGAAEFPREGDNYDALYRLADRRLYLAKSAGKNRIVLGGPGLPEKEGDLKVL